MNILLTTKCNKKCNYCFASSLPKEDMGLDQIDYLLNFPDFSQLTKIGILGGEPTLYPFLYEVISKIRQVNNNVVIYLFSNCENSPAILEKINDSNVVLVANCFSNDIASNVAENLKLAHQKGWTVALSYTITEPVDNSEEIIKFCKGYSIKIVRWSLAMPAYGINNRYIPLSRYSEMIPLIKQINKSLLKNKIATYNDCPVPLWCQISPNINEKNGPYVQGIKYGQCQPPYDIHPGYLVTGCMGIGDRITFALNSVHSVKELEQRYYSYVSNLRSTTCVSDINESANYGGACFGFTQKEELI